MKIYFWDFHGVLEKGSERTLSAAINRFREQYGMLPDCSDGELVGYFGPPLSKILFRFFPNHDLAKLTNDIRKLAVELTPQLMSPMDHAAYTLRRVRREGSFNHIITAADEYDVRRQLEALRLYGYMSGVHSFISNGNNTHSGEVHDFKADAIVNATLEAVNTTSSIPERVFVIGDTASDMRAAEEARKKFRVHSLSDSRFESIRVDGGLFDPDSRNLHVKADFRLRQLDDVFYLR